MIALRQIGKVCKNVLGLYSRGFILSYSKRGGFEFGGSKFVFRVHRNRLLLRPPGAKEDIPLLYAVYPLFTVNTLNRTKEGTQVVAHDGLFIENNETIAISFNVQAQMNNRMACPVLVPLLEGGHPPFA